jgi:serine protease AprX
VSTKLLVTLQGQDERQAVRDSGMEVLAEYPDSMLVRGTEEQAQHLSQQGVEAVPLPEEPVQVAGASFEFGDAVRAQEAASLDPPAGRTAYYLVKLAGPPAPEWLRTLEGLGGELQGTVGGFTQLVGMLPERVDEVRAQPWVEEVTPYRPAMKVSPKLRAGVRRELDTDALAAVAAEDLGDQRQLVEVSVFSGESVKEAASYARRVGGTVVATHPRSLIANLDPAAIAALATRQGVQAIVPFALPELHNDRAKLVMQIPVDHHFADATLKGTGQIVAIADSGLDSGDPLAMHADIQGRVAGLVSWPTAATWAPLVHEPGSDDGPVDENSGHGTHVTGSVLGAGAAAVQAGAASAPMGTAPEAKVFFQAIEQRVSWKTAEEFGPDGPPFEPWPPAPVGLRGIPADLNTLFQQAYLAGARIHTNSWGAPVAGDYPTNARAVDEFMWNHPDMLILFSAGNEGMDVDADGVIDADSIGSPGTAKNCLTVGASENNRPRGSSPPPGFDRLWSDVSKWAQLTAAGHMSDNVEGMAAFSSRGPTNDQRIKPDVVAPGTNILSTLSSAFPANKSPLWGRLPEGHPLRRFYCWSGGTSMATPLVAGAAALIRQHLVSQRGHLQENRKPSGALIKAILVNGAVAPRGQFAGEIPDGPNQVSGFGRVDVTRSVAPEPLHSTMFADEPDHAVSTGQMRTFQVRAAEQALPLKITLVWTDAPALAGVGGLVNQLYLQLQAPDGGITDGDLHPMLEVKNNVQQIVVPSPVAGAYTIRVRGVSVTRQSPGAASGAGPRQDFALAISNGVPATTAPDGVAGTADLLGSMAVAH